MTQAKKRVSIVLKIDYGVGPALLANLAAPPRAWANDSAWGMGVSRLVETGSRHDTGGESAEGGEEGLRQAEAERGITAGSEFPAVALPHADASTRGLIAWVSVEVRATSRSYIR